jgi:CobQ-like glutamine amidotransferase family enzyme
MDEPIRIGVVYPWLLGTYGDRGNAEVLVWRLRRRGHAAEVVDLPAPQAVPAGSTLTSVLQKRLRLIVDGHGQYSTRSQRLAGKDFLHYRLNAGQRHNRHWDRPHLTLVAWNRQAGRTPHTGAAE